MEEKYLELILNMHKKTYKKAQAQRNYLKETVLYKIKYI